MLGPSLTVVLLLGHASLWSICSAATLPREWQTDDKFQFIRNHFCNSTNGTSASQDMCRDMRQHNEKSICSVICSESRGQSEQMSNRRCYNSTGKLTLSTAPWDVCETGQYLHCYYTDTIVCGNNGNNGSCIYVNTTSIQPVCIYRDSTSMFQPPVIITSTTRKTTTTTNDDSTATPQEISTGRVDNLDGTTTAARRGGPRARQPNVVSIVLGVILGVVLLAVVLVACLCRRSKLLANKASSKEQMDFKESADVVNLPGGVQNNFRYDPRTSDPDTGEPQTSTNQLDSVDGQAERYVQNLPPHVGPITEDADDHPYFVLERNADASDPAETDSAAGGSASREGRSPSDDDEEHTYFQVMPTEEDRPSNNNTGYEDIADVVGNTTVDTDTSSPYQHLNRATIKRLNQDSTPGAGYSDYQRLTGKSEYDVIKISETENAD